MRSLPWSCCSLPKVCGGDENTPHIAGQLENFLKTQLWVFKNDLRIDPVMQPIAKGMTDQEIADAAAYWAAQPAQGEPWAGVDPALVEQGANLFNNGNVQNDLIACVVCHGPAGEGIPVANQIGMPRILGQAPQYVRDFMVFFRDFEDDYHSPAPNAMHIVVSALSEAELDAVTAYIASQPWGGEDSGE